MGYNPNEHPALDSNNIAIDDALAAYPGEFTYNDIIAAVKASGGIVNEASGAIGKDAKTPRWVTIKKYLSSGDTKLSN